MNEIQETLQKNDFLPPQREDSAPVQAILLQRHQACLRTIQVSRWMGRAISFAGLLTGGFMHLTMGGATAFAVYAVVLLITFLWQVEVIAAEKELKVLEEKIVKKSGGEWEDIYIKMKYEAVPGRLIAWLLRIEPDLWMAMAAVQMGVALRYWTFFPG
jgi:hypothetical protein